MKLYQGARFEESESWSGPSVAQVDNAVVKLRWTKDPYVWHANAGQEVFVVLDGIVNMHVRENGGERVIKLERGDVLHISTGEEHVAYPQGEARVLVVEQSDYA